MVHCHFDLYKWDGYVTKLYDNNIKNDLDTAIASRGIEKDYINSGYIYNNINNRRQIPTLWLLSTISNIKVQAYIPNLPILTISNFCTRSQFVPLNDWKDP